MNIVILDGFSANPGDLSWDELKEMGNVTVYDRTSPSETVARAAEADVVPLYSRIYSACRYKLSFASYLTEEVPVTLESRPLMALVKSSRSVDGLLYALTRIVPN